MSVGIVGAGANANAATGTTVAFTLPGSIPANSRLYLVTNSNGQLDTVTGVSNVTATQLDAQSPGTSMAASLQAADVGSANNGQTVTITWSGNGKLSCAWIVLSSAAASVDNQAVGLDNTNTNTAACSADFTTSSNFRSFDSGSLSLATTSSTDSRKRRRYSSF